MCSWFQHSWSRYSIPLSAGNQINVPQGCLGPYSWGCKLVPVGPFLPLDCYYVRLHDYLSRNVFLSFAGDWNTSETYSIQCYFGKQSSHTKFPVPHSDPAVWRLSLVIRVSLPSVLVEMRNISNNGNNTPCYYNVISFQETWKERWKEWQRLEAFLNESVWEGPEERSHHLQRSGRWAGGRIQLLRQPHVTQRRSESCRPALSQMHLDRRVYPISTITVFSKHVYDQKNIRRRVYDALNVLMAMNIISKEKKEIKWIGLPTNSAQECQNLEVRWSPSSVKHIIFPKSSPMTLLTGGEAKTAGADQAETITASGAHPAGIDGCWCSRVQLHTGCTHTPGPFWSFHLNSC